MKDWQRKEKEDAKAFKGKVNRGSGNRWFDPGDVKTDNLLIDSKDTTKASFSLSKKALEKLYEEALFAYRMPVMSINIQGLEVVVLWKKDLEELLEKKKLTTDSD